MSVRQPQTQDLNQSESLSSGFMYRLLGCTLILSASLLPGMAVQANPGNSSTNASIVAQAERTQLYVNPASGSDASGRGNTQAPFKTLTHALKVAKADTVIQLAPGTYSTETGEVFPIVMKSGVTIVGNPSTKGEGIVIRGGDRYLSPTFAVPERDGARVQCLGDRRCNHYQPQS
uniref:DUF1565 domain-containing protein n=1 Tax=Desertifilum tharense IPPAS B-1220 TaxID=1781255 RepID=A0ACD5GTC8_9CYAN